MSGPNWTEIEAAYRAGELSLRKIAAAQGITEGPIRAKAKKLGWTRNVAQETQPVTQPPPSPAQKLEPEPEEEATLAEDQGGDVIVNQKQLAKACAVTRQTITNWMGEGLPHWKPTPARTHFYLAAAITWILANKWAADRDDRGRKIKAEADMAEMEAAKMAGTLADAAEMRGVVEDLLSRLKANLRGFPDRVVPRMEEGANAIEKLAICRREMDNTLRSLVAQQHAHSRAIRGDEIEQA